MGMYEDFGDCTLFYRHALWLTPAQNKFPYIKHSSAVFCQGIIDFRRLKKWSGGAFILLILECGKQEGFIAPQRR